MNQFYNKQKAKLQSFVGDKGNSNRINNLTHKRNCKVNDHLHKSSRFIIDYCVQYQIKTIIVGKNKQWKTSINIGKKNNQNFVNIPHAKFINMLFYKAEEVGIKIILTEESYTSKCSALDFEKICKHSEYLGKRIKRGLFKDSIGRCINADINGALNIIRKAINDFVVKQIIDRGFVFNPIKINKSF